MSINYKEIKKRNIIIYELYTSKKKSVRELISIFNISECYVYIIIKQQRRLNKKIKKLNSLNINLDSCIYDIMISNKAKNCFKKMKIHKISELLKYTQIEIINEARYIGIKTINQVSNILFEYGITWR